MKLYNRIFVWNATLTPMTYLRSFAVVAFVWSSLMFTPGCGGSTTADDAGTPMDGSARRDGWIPLNTPCGANGTTCCSGRTCAAGLRCGSGDLCCIQAGGEGCNSAADCCRGLVCQANTCRVPDEGACRGSSDCTNGLVCHEGACERPENHPGWETCGLMGAMCCANSTCRAGLVCAGDNTCIGCGQPEQPCCDGESRCGLSLVCDGTTSTCIMIDPATSCGGPNRPCCDEQGRPGGTQCEGSLRCTATGVCMGPDDCGTQGAPCCPRGNCNSGLVCESSSNTCQPVPSECGRDSMMCCNLGNAGSSSNMGSCEGDLNCESGECESCKEPSLSCLLSGIIDGNECCNGTVCRPAPLLPRCCVGQGQSCENSLDCCGFMSCRNGSCACGEMDSFCTSDSECCSGLTCSLFQCKPEGPMCKELREACTGGDCCDGFVCRSKRVEMRLGPPQCCAQAGATCERSDDCCGEMFCYAGECQCGYEDDLCLGDGDCCEDLVCIAGACRNASSCGRERTACDPTLNQCCSGLACRAPEFGSGDRVCCVSGGNMCVRSEDCCGHRECTEGRCVCQQEGSSCATSFDCCDGLTCASGVCAAPSVP